MQKYYDIVLIETYWNVNISRNEADLFSQFCINRNILECKYQPYWKFHSKVQVLIETYWNVNECYKKKLEEERCVLIETYWNVNLDTKGIFVLGIAY